MDIEELAVEAHSVVSFKAFEMQHKPRLKSMYPFLSADQINGKLKKQWEKLEERERQCFTRKCYKVTPVKESRPKTSKRVASKKSNGKVGVCKKRQKDSLDVCDTPEYVNTEKLNDFRKQHKEYYYNDFFRDRFETQDPTVVFGPSNGDQQKSRHRGSHGQDSSLDKQQGILKSSDSGRKDQARGRVSFNSTVSQDNVADSAQGGNYNFRSDSDSSDPPGGFSDDDDAGLLLRRGDSQTDYDDYAMANPMNSSDDDDDDDVNVLIRREMDDYGNMANDEDSQSQEKDSTNRQLTKNTSKPTRRSADLRQTMKGKPAQENKTLENDADADLIISKTSESSQDDILFKSPIEAESKTRMKSKGLQNAKKSDVSETPLIGTSTSSDAQETPAIQSNPDEKDMITPQMDGVMQQLINMEVVKAPLKRKNDGNNVGETANIHDIVPSKRVTRSLMSQANEKMETGKENTQNIKRTRSARNIKKHKKIERQSKSRPKNDEPNEPENQDETLAAMNASGDAHCSAFNEVTGDFGFSFMKRAADLDKEAGQLGSNDKQDDEELETTAQSSRFRINLKDKLRGDFTLQYHGPKPGCSTDSDSWSSSQESASSSIDTQPSSGSNRRNQVNPALLKALRSIQMSAEPGDHALQWSSDDGEMSPALSGVTELSSSESTAEDGDKASTQESSKLTVASTVQMQACPAEDGLCDMFEELTPPDRKTKGQYKTQRLLASGNVDRTRSFKQLFQHEEDFFS